MRSAMVCGAVASLIGLGQALSAQAPSPPPRPSFEVVSIKQSKALTDGGSLRLGTGEVTVRNIPLRLLIATAYEIRSFLVLDGPGWITQDRFDIDTKAEGNPTIPQRRLMLQSLLADRFKLVVHSDTRDIKGFALVTARSNQLGPNLRPSSLDCEQSYVPACNVGMIRDGDLKAIGISMSAFAYAISGEVGGIVSDETKVTGTFDMELKWSPEFANSPDLPSIFTAIQEQLGLRLESRLVPTKVLIVDRAERPDPN